MNNSQQAEFSKKVELGRTGLMAGRLGIASSYGAPADAFEEAFERGCNYFTVGSFIRGRSGEMCRAIRNITAKGKREELIVSLAEYTHSPLIGSPHLMRGLRKLGLEYVDVLFLGYYPNKPRRGIIDWAVDLREKGLIRHIGLSSHRRSVFPGLEQDGIFDVFHVRYNPVNSGAENDVFPLLPAENRPGIVSFTATRWGQLLKQKKMPPGEKPLNAVDCYRFALSHPSVNVCLSGPRNSRMMQENLRTLEEGPLNEEEMSRVRKIGNHIYRRSSA